MKETIEAIAECIWLVGVVVRDTSCGLARKPEPLLRCCLMICRAGAVHSKCAIGNSKYKYMIRVDKASANSIHLEN